MDHLTKVLPYIQKYWSTAKEVVCLSECVSVTGTAKVTTLTKLPSLQHVRKRVLRAIHRRKP